MRDRAIRQLAGSRRRGRHGVLRPGLATVADCSSGQTLSDGVYRQQQMLPCVDPVAETTQDEVVAAVVISPLQRALIGWQAWAQPLAPSVLTQPTTYSVVGVPTIVSVDDYQPDYDIDDDARTITWALPDSQIDLRATAAHRIRWNDDDTPPTDWLDTNGRPYLPGDETGQPYASPEPIAHVYTVKGDRTIQVDVRWTGHWRDAGGPWEPLPADPIFLVQSYDLDVHEIQAVLTNGS